MASQRLLDGLHAVHRALHHRIEVLHAETGAVEAERGVARDVAGAQEARVELDREVPVGMRGQVEVAAQALHELADLLRDEEVRRAAAEVHLHDLAVAVEPARQQFRSRAPAAVDRARRATCRA